MNKADIVDRIATGTGLTKLETEAVVNGFMATIIEALKQGESVELRGFGTFKPQFREARTARNPQTDEPIEIGDRYVPVFKASKKFRQQVNRTLRARG